MRKVAVLGWNPGFQKIQFTELLRGDFGYSLSKAKAATDAVLDQKRVELEVQDTECMRLLPRLNQLGARAVLED